MDICGKPKGLFTPEITPDRAARACSACAGDYEDPDRTAPPRQDEEEDGPVALEPGSENEAEAAERGRILGS